MSTPTFPHHNACVSPSPYTAAPAKRGLEVGAHFLQPPPRCTAYHGGLLDATSHDLLADTTAQNSLGHQGALGMSFLYPRNSDPDLYEHTMGYTVATCGGSTHPEQPG